MCYITLLFLAHHSVLCDEHSNKLNANSLSEFAFNMTFNYDNITSTNQIDSKPSIIADIDVCRVCWCSKKDTLDCRRADQLDSLPVIPDKADRLQITEM